MRGQNGVTAWISDKVANNGRLDVNGFHSLSECFNYTATILDTTLASLIVRLFCAWDQCCQSRIIHKSKGVPNNRI